MDQNDITYQAVLNEFKEHPRYNECGIPIDFEIWLSEMIADHFSYRQRLLDISAAVQGYASSLKMSSYLQTALNVAEARRKARLD
jgi:hypothetical protein